MRRALRELLEAKPFDQITIREITRTAGVSYPTFFRNYASRGDLLGDIGAKETRQLLALMAALVDRKDAQLSADAIRDYVRERRVLWRTLLTTEASFIMREEFVRLSAEFVRERGRIIPDLPIELAASFVVGAMFEILSWWLRQPEDYPSEKISRFLKILVLEATMSPH